jgi:dynein assembly factor 5, axonemal
MVESKATLDVIIVKIQNQERMIRQNALKELLEFVRNENDLTKENAMEIFDTLYLSLAKCYSDRFEMCRSLSCSIITEIVSKIEQNEYYLEQLVPLIAKRLASQETVEESEEMRLQLLKQLRFIINKYQDFNETGTIRSHSDGDDPILKPYNDIIDILKESLIDNYPAILKECCEIIKITSVASPSFHYRAEALVNPLLSLLNHRHSPIRIAAIEALGIVALNIFSNVDIVKRIIKDISPLLMDQNAFVRRECGRVGCLFLMKLRDRYGLFERILPLVLCCLNDEIEEVRDEIEKLWIEAGTLFYHENEADFQDQAIIDKVPDNYPTYLKRPTFGCRAIVKKALQVLNIILHEMEDWKDEVRLHSTKLLMQVVIHCEDHLDAKYYDINAVLCKTCQDKEFEVAKCALEVAKLVGVFVMSTTWSKFIFDELKIRQSKLGVIKCTSMLYETSNDKSLFMNLNELSEILLDTSFCHNDNECFQIEFINLLNILIRGIDDEKTFENFYIITLKTTTVSYDNDKIQSLGCEVLNELCEKSKQDEVKSVDEMHGKYLKKALKTLDLLDSANNSDGFEQVTILYGIICLSGFQVRLKCESNV